MAEPIEIIIRKGSGGEGTGFGVPGANANESSGRGTKMFTEGVDENQNLKRFTKAVVGFGLATLKRQITYSIGQYGNKTGNYIAQAEIQSGMEIFNNVLGIGTATIGGATMGGVPGAIAGFVISAANVAIGYNNQYQTLQTNIAKLNTYANIMQERSGNTYNNDSRGTYE